MIVISDCCHSGWWWCHEGLLGHNARLLMIAIYITAATCTRYIRLLPFVLRQPGWWWCHVGLQGHNACCWWCAATCTRASWLMMSCRAARAQCLAVNDRYIRLLPFVLRQPSWWWCHVGLQGHNAWLLMVAKSEYCHLYSGSQAADDVL